MLFALSVSDNRFHTKPFEITFSMTWRSWHYTILFFSYGKETNGDTRSLCCLFYLVISFLINQKIKLSLSRTGNFRGLVCFKAKAKDFKMCPRGLGRPRGFHLCYSCSAQ